MLGVMSTFEVRRTAVIPAAAEDIFPLVNSFHEWPAWSPWETVDPGMSRRYFGSDSGVGAGYEWSGNRKAQKLYEAYGFEKAGEYQYPVGRWLDDEFILRRG